MSVGPRIRELRKERRWPLRNLSAFSGVSVSYLSEIERGEEDGISIGVLRKVAAAFEVSPADLLDSRHTGEWQQCPRCAGKGVVWVDLRPNG